MEIVEDTIEIDLDAIATVRPEAEVVEAMRPWLLTAHSHPDSAHSRGARARQAVERARASVAALIGVAPEELVFTSGGTESSNLAIHGWVAAQPAPPCAIAVAVHEPPALLHPCRSVARSGIPLDLIAVGRDGRIAPDSMRRAPLALLAFSHAHPELGTLQCAQELVEHARALGAASLADVSLTLGRVACDRASLGEPAMISLSFHRMGGPMGVGALAIREGVRLLPLQQGGAGERGARPGSPNLAGIVGAGVASDRARTALHARTERLERWGRELSAGVLSVPGVRSAGPGSGRRLPGHVCVLVDGVDGEALVTALDDRGILASTGSPCAGSAGLPSAALIAAGYGRDEARSAVVLCVPPVGGPDEAGLSRAIAVFRAETERLRRVAGLVAPTRT